ncbi:EF-hand domain-containing protein [Caulobacter sp. BE254]|uniref:EF-hand domain-containing protein n=1 Tax=Caulobacter sp. BE254 TaxID=2817720 RepID=UPI0028635953|nr:EF-hand domain-containing protein [Caulobacter sp. BE254]MDR7115091.1 Ca2+-binding EF-hand superfamily protein [Caulobacter sp. BE254]
MKGDTMGIGASGIQREGGIPAPRFLNLGGMAMLSAVKDQVFKTFDADQDGKVSAQEIAKLGNNDPDKLADKQALVSAFDRNGDGALDSGEFGASRLLDSKNLKTLLGVQDEAGVAKWLVSRADTDGDGALSAAEYAGVASPSSGRIDAEGASAGDSPEQVNAEVFSGTDADQNGRLSTEELTATLEAAPHIFRFGDSSQTAGVLAARYDGDGDGVLSADELMAAAKARNLDPTAVGDLIKSADRDGDMKLSGDELRAASQRRSPAFQPIQVGHLPAPPSNGEALLARLLGSTLRSLSDQTASELGGALNRKA